MTSPFRVLILCTGNSARSQIAEALLATKGAWRIAAGSAGSHPASRVHPGAVQVLARHGIVWDGKVPKTIDEVAGTSWDLLITVCDHANDSCPVFPGKRYLDWELDDPSGRSLEEVRPIRDEID